MLHIAHGGFLPSHHYNKNNRQKPVVFIVPMVGLGPTSREAHEFESCVFTSFTTSANLSKCGGRTPKIVVRPHIYQYFLKLY